MVTIYVNPNKHRYSKINTVLFDSLRERTTQYWVLDYVKTDLIEYLYYNSFLADPNWEIAASK